MILLPLLAVVAGCWPTFVALHREWTDWTNTSVTHGYLVVGICLWLLWRRRRALRNLGVRPDRLGMTALGMVALLWLFVTQAGLQILAFALLPWLLYFAVRGSTGKSAAATAAFPIFYFYFAIPVWGVVNGVFQWASIYAARFALRAAGVPAFFEGNHVQIPDGTFEIAEGCSGLHFVVVGLSIAALLGELRGDGRRGRLRLAGIALVLAVLTNWVRVFTVILAGHVSHMQNYLVARSHYGYGWVLFAVAMLLLLLIERKLPVKPSPSSVPNGPTPAVGAARTATAPLAVVGALCVVRIWHALAMRPSPDVLVLPTPPGDWRQLDMVSGWRPRFEGADAQKRALYRSPDGSEVELFAALYRSQQQGRELGGYENDVFGGLELVDTRPGPSTGAPVLVRRARDRAGGEHLLTATYSVADRYFSNPDIAQLWYAVRSLAALRSPASRVLLSRSACHPDCEAAARRLHELKD